MRSELTFAAASHIQNRFELASAVMVAARALHKPNTRVADSINVVLERIGATAEPIVHKRDFLPAPPPIPQASPSSPRPEGLRARASRVLGGKPAVAAELLSAVQHRTLGLQEELKGGAQVREAGQPVVVARHQPHARGIEMSQGREAVVLT